jgi:membrane-associated protease RseP (regulator of RpoE activity)
MINLNTVNTICYAVEQQKNKNKVHVDIKLPLIFVHTPFGLTFFDRVAKTNAAKIYAKFNAYLMPLITAFAIFLIVGSLMIMFSNAAARDTIRNVGPRANFLIPILNPFFPVTYGLVALIITLVIHEAGHGIVARVFNIKVESTGILLFLGIPIGAFVNIEREELARASLKQKSSILTAGALNNMIAAVISLVALYFVILTLTPLPTSNEPHFGVVVTDINDGSLAEKVGLTKGSIIQTIAGQNVRSVEDLGNLLRSNLGHSIVITWKDKTGENVMRSISLPSSVQANKGIMGIFIRDVAPNPSVVLQRYKNAFTSNPIALLTPPTLGQGMYAVPYSDLMASKYESNIIGPSFPVIANILFWIWFINFNVGIFNALPISFLDGGSWYSSLIESKTRSKTTVVKNAALLLSLVMIVIVIMSITLPYFIR